MNLSNYLNPKQVLLMKRVVLGLGGLLALFVVAQFLAALASPFLSSARLGYGGTGMTGSYNVAQDSAGKMAEGSAPRGMPSLSDRNVMPIAPPTPTSPSGADAEAFEVKNYQGSIETRALGETCGALSSLKAKSYVIFENATQSTTNCYFTFKVEKSHVEEVLATVKALHPKDLSENIQTIKRTIDDFTSQTDILLKRQATIEKTLDDAVKAYDAITDVATRGQDASSLSNIITSKLQIVERLTQERLDISDQLDRLSRAKADQLDRLEYTYFSLNVYENKFVDGQQLQDSWKMAVKEFAQQLNKIAQDLTITLVTFLLLAVQYIIYLVILLLIAKYLWRFAKYLWQK